MRFHKIKDRPELLLAVEDSLFDMLVRIPHCIIHPRVILREDTMPFLIVLAVAICYHIHLTAILLNEFMKISHCVHLL